MNLFFEPPKRLFFGFFALCALSGCHRDKPSDFSEKPPEKSPSGTPHFTNVGAEVGLHFRHDYGGDKPVDTLETTGAGGCFFDFDNDGWQDIYLVNSGRVEKGRLIKSAPGVLFHNNGDGTFADVTQKAGVAGRGFGMGAAAADFDGDGFVDLYVYGYGGSTLYRNKGNGTFADVTAKAKVSGPAEEFAVTAAWGDFDGDGHLDLFVGNYLKWNPQRELCPNNNVQSACSPGVYDGQGSHLYRNNGDGSFSDVGAQVGVKDTRGKPMAVLFFDENNDGKQDIFVANDQTGNKLYLNRGDKFADATLQSGTGYDETGRSQASMGTDIADYNGDGRLDIAFGTFQNDANTLYRNDGRDIFSLVSWPANIGGATLERLAFGTLFLDYDNDGRPDLFFANGHVSDNVAQYQPGVTWKQPDTLLRNVDGRKFEDVSPALGQAFTQPRVGRGCARGDFNNDGWLDILVNNSGDAPFLLRNEGMANRHWITLKLEMSGPNRDAIGARVELVVGKHHQVDEVRAGSGGYLASNDLRLHFGLGETTRIDSLQIRWPDGKKQKLTDLPTNKFITIHQSKGIVATRNPAISSTKKPSVD